MAKAPMAFMTWRVMFLNGQQAGIRPIQETPIRIQMRVRPTGWLRVAHGMTAPITDVVSVLQPITVFSFIP